MPGVVKRVQCEEGDSVAQGAIIVTLEAMKMQNPLFAPKTGRVSGRCCVCTRCMELLMLRCDFLTLE